MRPWRLRLSPPPWTKRSVAMRRAERRVAVTASVEYHRSCDMQPRLMATQPSKSLETFPNPAPQRDYEIAFDCPEFTCVCPMTGQPDFAHFRIRYTPDQKCVELKSLKLYLWSFRDEGTFHEAVTNRIEIGRAHV